MLATLLDQSLRFEYLCGGVTPLAQPHTTEWRTLPGLMCSQVHRGRDMIFLSDGRKLPVATGELMVMPAGVFHKIDLWTPRGMTRWAHVNYYILDRLDLFSLLDVPPVVPRRLGVRVGDAIQEWVEFVSDARPHDAVAVAAKRNEFGFRILGLLADVCRPTPRALEKRARVRELGPLIEHIHTNYAKPLDRDELAEQAHLSAAQFHRVFRETTGTTPVGYLRSVRLRHAQRLLMSTRLPIAEVGRRVGYEDPFVFSKFFKRDAGLGPREYRARTAGLGSEPSSQPDN